MSADMIQAVQAVQTALPTEPSMAPSTVTPAGSDFSSWFVGQVDAVNATISTADRDVTALASGQAVSLHSVMMHLEEARLSFQLLAQVRNHVLDAYQEVMRTQV